MSETPLLNSLMNHIKAQYTGFHTPGHQQNSVFYQTFQQDMVKNAIKMDLTELPGLDNLKNPLGCIKKAQNLSSELFNSYSSFFLVNGSTVGIHAALLCLDSDRTKTIIPRNAHVSVLNGFVLSGGTPIVSPVTIDSTWGIPLPIQAEKLAEFANNNGADAILLSQPTYQGIGANIFELGQVCTERKLPLLVDEAHGPHMYFQKKLPLSAQQSKADIVVHSIHKTLSSLTQTSLLHVNNAVYHSKVKRALEILQTTSPSYLLMASLDSMQAQMHENGSGLVGKIIEMAEYFRSEVCKIDGIKIYGESNISPWYQDPTKIMLSAAEIGLTGWELGEILQQEYGIIVEQADYYYVLLLLTVGHTYNQIKILLSALKNIYKYAVNKPLAAWGINLKIFEENIELRFTPRQVFNTFSEELPLKSSHGLIAAAPITSYPPGVPLVLPGQVIKKHHQDYLEWAQGKFPVQGLTEDGKVAVIREIR